MSIHKHIYREILLLIFATALLLMIPLLAMQFSPEVDWTPGDFIVMGGLLFSIGLSYLLVTRLWVPRLAKHTIYRVGLGFALATGFLLIWVNLAVGIVGSAHNPFNLFCFGVILVGLIGAAAARFQPGGMAWTMLAMALCQALITAVALAGGYYLSPPATPLRVVGVNGFFIGLYVIPALLFRFAARNPGAPSSSGKDQSQSVNT